MQQVTTCDFMMLSKHVARCEVSPIVLIVQLGRFDEVDSIEECRAKGRATCVA